ncbi:MAG: hydroxyacylglutathione hydrolase [Pseudomonadota bacterium]
MLDILQIPVLNDNYVYLVRDHGSGATAVVDPAVAQPVIDALEHKGWQLTHILNTHHHGDHVGANVELKRKYRCTIAGARADRHRIPGIDVELAESDIFSLGESNAVVLEVPGHTVGHIAYYFPDDAALFCGDTLFVMGCGRLFEGSAKQMWQSLEKLKALPGHTRIYCAHEYTQTNGRFALTVEPENPSLRQIMRTVDELRRQNRPTVPSTLDQELATNPFLRSRSHDLQKTLDMVGADPLEVFAETRRRKDRF